MRCLPLAAFLFSLALSGCDREADKTPDELLAEDTTLAMDLARVNDALDEGEPDASIELTGDAPAPELTPPLADAREARDARDADLRVEAPARVEPPIRRETPPRVADEPRPVRTASRTSPVPPAPAAQPAPRPAPPPAAPVRLGPAAADCESPAATDQRSCLVSLLAQYDVGLNAAYRDVIQRMRREAGVAAGAPDPASVRELRAAQRSWLVYRDQECRRRTQSREGELWAPMRARCLGQLSGVRASVLRDM